ncbi:primary-amine oxidase [Blastococcus sp. VKM Ac-2987]|uniref:primary-amine oxidase n=1 Tax=Blastococcus sp. VKM Ac-2987 TaxID=3004141 RepID=UPI0022AB89F2|nr:primary-amine oxidase [Blastococcus sp. VKM Ac-2987]MCZ2859950.1 primary-amine oxidase [Blastococcus sp. VKM Ac-2987]
MAVDTALTDLPGAPTAAAPHPLDPLSGEEIERTASIVGASEHATPTLRFVMISLAEPVKPAGLAFDPADVPPRQAFVVAYDGARKLIFEGVVDLDAGMLASWTPVPGRFPSYLAEHMDGVEKVVVQDPRWQEAMRKRGVTDFDLAMVDPWPTGYYGAQDHYDNSPLLCRPLTFIRSEPGEHGYARPVEGVIVTFDLDAMAVVDVEDHGVVPLPRYAGNYEERFLFREGNRPAFSQFRDDLKPIEITQPEGPSFTVDGHSVTWQKWALRVGFNPREGLVLHQLSYTDRGVERPIMYRAALSEMVVPYGDTAPTHWNKNVFDMGEVGMGLMANPLTLGCDCLGEIFYFDGVVNDSLGNAVTIPNAICMHEEDYGIAWKHTDFRTGVVEVRRSRRLVISFIATVGNYEYGFFWYLYTDGNIEYEVKLTGVLTTGAIAEGEKPRYGNLVAPGLYGPHHQHHFNVRMDMCVDGPGNSVYEVDSVPEPDPALNPHSNAWITRETLVASEAEGARDWEFSTARYWKVVNPSKVNELGSPVGYKLMPRDVVPSMLQEGSAIYDRARFVQHNLWVTRYEPRELYAAGDYPYQSPDAQGLPEYLADDAPLEDTDVVLWYTVGAHHVVRPEDWPVMPCAYIGFMLKPVGFFDGNPALDLPPSASCSHCPAGACTCGHSETHRGLPLAENGHGHG